MNNTDKSKKFGQLLFALARASIAEELGIVQDTPKMDGFEAELSRSQGVFVTLHLHGALRGCIGTIEPVHPLAKGVKKNARHAAFRDTRFAPLTATEFQKIDLEISLLSVPTPLDFTDPGELIDTLQPGIHGVIIKKGMAQATFLPQVWEQLPDPRLFLSRLCEKAGLTSDAWMRPGLVVSLYEVASFAEKNQKYES